MLCVASSAVTAGTLYRFNEDKTLNWVHRKVLKYCAYCSVHISFVLYVLLGQLVYYYVC